MKQRLIMRPNNHETNPDHIAIDFFMFFRTYTHTRTTESPSQLSEKLFFFGIWFYLTSSLSKPGINVFKICPVFLLKDLRVNESGFLLKNIANIRARTIWIDRKCWIRYDRCKNFIPDSIHVFTVRRTVLCWAWKRTVEPPLLSNNSHFCIVLACSPYFNLSTLAIKPSRFQEDNPL